MKKLIYITLLITTIISAKETQMTITSKNFEADEKKHSTIFAGNVVITKNSDTIKADTVTVLFDEKNQPDKYSATGNVDFKITLKQSTIFGKCEQLVYVPKSKVYTISGNVNITEEPSKRKIQATKVIIDTINNKTTITGQKNKPVKFIFNLKEEK